MQPTPLQLAIQVFYFFWGMLGFGILLIHIEFYFSGKFKLIPRYYLGSLILFTLTPILFSVGAYWKPVLTIANTAYVLGFIEFSLAVRELKKEVSKVYS
jgi:hypothetical protein